MNVTSCVVVYVPAPSKKEGLGHMGTNVDCLAPPAMSPGEGHTFMLTTSPNIIDIADPYPEMSRRITTSLALKPEHHRILAQLGLDLGLDRQSIVRRALVVAGVLPAVDDSTSTLNTSEVEGA